ncbi:MAG TPA: sugar ABC transporter substrate-binding protein [Planctomycetaceae bacterium]|nr:sugar ABC transporter substrate-binding protein [Planctomycetaceae bacterium]
MPAPGPYSAYEQYPLRPGDRLEFTLSVEPHTQQNGYRLMPGDELSVEYRHEPTERRAVRRMKVLPDGSIHLPELGRVEAAGKTVGELTAEVNRLARRFYKHPDIAIWATETMGRAEELRRAFSTGFTNQSLTAVVGPDGTIDLPVIGRVYVFGRTLPEVTDEVNRRYAELVPGVSVWPRIVQRAPERVYVLGQVDNPGEYLLERPTHVSQLIAMAGGYTLGSELRRVILIRYRSGRPMVRELNLHDALWQDTRAGRVDLSDDIILADGDVIVVPRDHIQKGDDLIRRVFTEGIYGLLPSLTQAR